MLNDRKCDVLKKRNLVKMGMWKCSGTISRNVCDCELLGESKGEQEKVWIMQERINEMDERRKCKNVNHKRRI